MGEWPFVARSRLSRALRLCALLAVHIAVVRYLLLRLRAPWALSWLSGCEHGCWWALRRISFARLAHQLLSPFASLESVDAIESRIVVQDETHALAPPCLVAFFHSPWNWALAPWLASRKCALVCAGARWQVRLGTSYVAPDLVGLATIARHLRSGGRAVILVDKDPGAGGCEVTFLSRRIRCSPAVARLAGVARVPVVPCVCTWREGCFQLSVGRRIEVGRGPAGAQAATQALMAFFDQAIRDDPATGVFLSYLRERTTMA